MGPLPTEPDSTFGSPLERAEGLLQAFVWSDTPQGHEYWEQRFWRFVEGSKRKALAKVGDRAGRDQARPEPKSGKKP